MATTTPAPQPLPDPQFPWFDPKTGKPTLEYARWAKSVDDAIRTLCGKI